MRLVVTTPSSIIADADEVQHVRAEDETGAFGIMPHHADFLTLLAISVVSWRDTEGAEHHVAVRGGVLSVQNGSLVQIATKEVVREDDLSRLQDRVLDRFREADAEEEEARAAATRLHIATIRRIQRVLEASRQATGPNAMTSLRGGDRIGGEDDEAQAS